MALPLPPVLLRALAGLLLLCAAPLPRAGSAPPGPRLASIEMMEQARELGRMGATAELCEMDEPALIARQTGIQLSANLMLSSYPEESQGALRAFGEAIGAARAEYGVAGDPQKSRLCAFAWLSWRAARHASSMSSAAPDLEETTALAQSAGSIHGWLWRCQRHERLGESPGRDIGKQAAMSLAFGALSSSRMDDLLSAQAAWSKAFSDGLADEEFKDDQCETVAQSMPKLARAFDRSRGLASSLGRAKAAKARLLGLAL